MDAGDMGRGTAGLRGVAVLLAFMLGAGLGALGLRSISRPTFRNIENRLAFLARHGDDYDAIALGSSVVAVNFRPKVFDERLKQLGHPLSTYAFGVSGLMGAEMDYCVERILELHLPRLKWLLYDLTLDQTPRLAEVNWYTPRVVEWHNPRQYAVVQRQIFATDKPRVEQLQQLWPHVRHLLLNVLNVGKGVPMLKGVRWGLGDAAVAKTAKKRKPMSVKTKLRRRDKKEADALAYRKRSHRQYERSRRRLISLRKHPAKSPRANWLAAGWRDAARAQGVASVFFIGAALDDSRMRTTVRGAPQLQVLDLNDPEAFPKLYDIKFRYDRLHCTEDGARLFSQVLAERFTALLSGQVMVKTGSR